MFQPAAEALEFSALLNLVKRYLVSPLGAWQAEQFATRPLRTSSDEARAALAEVAETMDLLALAEESAGADAVAAPRFSGLQDTRAAAERVRVEGAVLEAHDIQSLLELLERAEETRRRLLAQHSSHPRLAAYAESLPDFRPLLRELSGKILPNGEVADSASRALARIRRHIEQHRKSVHKLLEQFVRRHYQEGLLQEDYVTIRNGRLVVPVKTTWKSRVEGVIHSTSSTGQTVFVEPLETIELNNRLARMIEEEMHEVRRVLAAMTARLRQELPGVWLAIETLARLEFLFAKAKFGREFRCTIPSFVGDGAARLRLRRARHPLLEDVVRREQREIVPLTLKLDENRRLLVISGPNAGGKTIILKTVGLLILMAQAGLPVPADEAEFPWCEQVLADIGDSQSITESLSTFSAHIEQIRQMLARGGPRSLVLLDELGAATDPEEGGALGVAVAEHFLGQGSLTIISTHLPALKTFAAATPGAANAAVGFDDRTFTPTYKLLPGVPGQSAGLAMAARLGLPSSLIERARRVLDTQTEQTGTFLQHLHELVEEHEAAEKRLRLAEQQVRDKERKLAGDWKRRETAKLRALETRLEELIKRFESEHRTSLEELGEVKRREVASAQRRFARARREVREDFESATSEALGRPAATRSSVPAVPVAGAAVRLGELGATGRVLQELSDGRWEVEVGQLKMRVSAEDITEVIPSEQAAPRSGANRIRIQRAEPQRPKVSEINVIGQTREQAQDAVDKFLDDAVLADVERVRIIHGHGKNVLRGALWRMFSTHPQVARYYQAEQHEGGAGATIVEVKL